MRTSQAFTIVELLIVVAIIGILAVLGAGGARTFLLNARLNNAVTTVESQIDEARRLAKRLDRAVPVVLGSDADGWFISVDGTARRIDGATVTSGNLTFNLDAPYGTYSGPQAEIDLSVGGIERTVIMTGVLARTVVSR